MTESDLRTPDEAAAYLRVSRRTFDAHVAAGDIAYIQIGRGLKRKHRLYDPADLDSFREAQRRRQCPSTKGPGRSTGRSTSNAVVVDFQDQLEQRRDARRNARKLANGRPPARA